MNKMKGSYTLEAAVIFPLAAALFATILFFFRIMQVETLVQKSLVYASRKTAAEAELLGSAGELVSAEILFRKDLGTQPLIEDYIQNGKKGITLIGSGFTDDLIHLKASYRIKMPTEFFFPKSYWVSQSSVSRKWTGKNVGTETGEEAKNWVYVTRYGTVYHRTTECPYLDLSIEICKKEELPTRRNRNGEKYDPCKECLFDNKPEARYYITAYGDRYHQRISCSGLKRTIFRIDKKEVGTKTPCSKCSETHK